MTAVVDAGEIRGDAGIDGAAASLLTGALLVGACLNGLAVRVLEAWRRHGIESPLMGITPFEIIAILVAARLVMQPDARRTALWPWPELALGAAMLVPSSAVVWGAVAVYSLLGVRCASPGRRGGIALFLALAACSIWSSVLLKWIAGPAAALEAHAVWALLSPWRPDMAVTGNVVGVPEGHNLIIMIACTAASGVPKALLGLVALVMLAGGGGGRRTALAGVMVAGLHAAVNTLRLMLMAWSGALYLLIHGPIGANAFDAAQTLLVVALGLWAAKA